MRDQTLTYWVAFPVEDDLPVLRGLTKLEVQHQIKDDWDGYEYEVPREVSVDFHNPLDLLFQITDPDDGLVWELPP